MMNPPTSIHLKLSGREALSTISACKRYALAHAEEKTIPENVVEELKGYDDGDDEITMETLKAAYAIIKLQSSEDQKDPTKKPSILTREDIFYNNVLRGARATFPLFPHRKATEEEKAKEKEIWRKKLRERYEQRQYDMMVQNVHWGGGRKPEIETRPLYQASIAFNIVAAMVTAGFLGYYVAGSFVNKESHRMVVAIITGMGMLIVEMVLYIIRTTEIERYAGKRQRNEELGRKGMTIPTKTSSIFSAAPSSSPSAAAPRIKAKKTAATPTADAPKETKKDR